jgi:hypothetical protein
MSYDDEFYSQVRERDTRLNARAISLLNDALNKSREQWFPYIKDLELEAVEAERKYREVAAGKEEAITKLKLEQNAKLERIKLERDARVKKLEDKIAYYKREAERLQDPKALDSVIEAIDLNIDNEKRNFNAKRTTLDAEKNRLPTLATYTGVPRKETVSGMRLQPVEIDTDSEWENGKLKLLKLQEKEVVTYTGVVTEITDSDYGIPKFGISNAIKADAWSWFSHEKRYKTYRFKWNEVPVFIDSRTGRVYCADGFGIFQYKIESITSKTEIGLYDSGVLMYGMNEPGSHPTSYFGGISNLSFLVPQLCDVENAYQDTGKFYEYLHQRYAKILLYYFSIYRDNPEHINVSDAMFNGIEHNPYGQMTDRYGGVTPHPIPETDAKLLFDGKPPRAAAPAPLDDIDPRYRDSLLRNIDAARHSVFFTVFSRLADEKFGPDETDYSRFRSRIPVIRNRDYYAELQEFILKKIERAEIDEAIKENPLNFIAEPDSNISL